MKKLPNRDTSRVQQPLLVSVERLLAEERYAEAVAKARRTLEEVYSTQNKRSEMVSIVQELEMAINQSREIPKEEWDLLLSDFKQIESRLKQIISDYGEIK
jgi:hypothetical protein